MIAHNFITGMGSSAIAAHPALALAGPNSFFPTNCIIMDNVLADGGCSYEAATNLDPTDEPVWALLQLHKAIATTDYIPVGQEISGIRILNNAFLQWRRGAITLHNVSDANIIGNYFSPPMTNDGLVTLTNHVTMDLWACDYNTMRFENNVKPAILPNAQAVRKDGAFVTITNSFQPLTSPRLALAKVPDNVFVSWTSIAPGFVLQQANALGAATNWIDVSNLPYLAGASNIVSLPFSNGTPGRFYRASQVCERADARKEFCNVRFVVRKFRAFNVKFALRGRPFRRKWLGIRNDGNLPHLRWHSMRVLLRRLGVCVQRQLPAWQNPRP
ncbi:MAG: hypothetical protein WDN00_12325 [Limisphaerales bacterium]